MDKYQRKALRWIKQLHSWSSTKPVAIEPAVSSWLKQQQRRFRAQPTMPLKLITEQKLKPLSKSGRNLYRLAQEVKRIGESIVISENSNDQIMYRSFEDFSRWHLWNARRLKSFSTIKRLKSRLNSKGQELIATMSPGKRSPYHALTELLYQNLFISMDVHQEGETCEFDYQCWKTPQLELHLYRHPKDPQAPKAEEIAELVQLLERFRPHRQNHLTLTILGGQQKKYLSEYGLTPYSINSGCCLPGEYIMLWRNEEWRKVLIHELIHFHQYDFAGLAGYQAFNQRANQRFKIEGIDFVNEAFTDTLALLLNAVVAAEKQGLEAESILPQEISHCLVQSSKVIHNLGGIHATEIDRIPQSTSGYSYYVVKGGLMLALPEFLKLLERPTLSGFEKLVNSTLNHPEYHEWTEAIIPHLGRMEGYYGRTMRMSIL